MLKRYAILREREGLKIRKSKTQPFAPRKAA
jgi:hypothetical protein